MAANGNGHNGNGNGNGHKNGKAKPPLQRPALTAKEIVAITAAIVLGHTTQAELAEQFKCHPKTIQRVAASIPDREAVRELSSKPKTIDNLLMEFMSESSNAAIAILRHLQTPEQQAKHSPEQSLAIFNATSERVLFLASAAERARARLQDAGQGQLPPAEQCVEDESGAIDGEVT